MALDPAKTAVLSLDLQEGIFGLVPGAAVVLPNAAKVVEGARQGGFRLLHVGLGFEPGYPEVSPRNPRFTRMKEQGAFVKGSDSARIHSALLKPGDTVIYKQRVSAFSDNTLHMVLQAQGIEHLVLFGVATSGVVLSTLRRAADLDYQCTVVKDACFDRDEEVHRVLTEKVFIPQATVVTAQAFLAENASVPRKSND